MYYPIFHIKVPNVMKMSIFMKVIISYIILLVLILFVGLYNYFEMESSSLRYNQLLNNTKSIDEVRNIQVDFKKQVQEWKNILIRGHNNNDFNKYHEGFLKQYASVREHGKIVPQLDITKEQLTILNRFLTAHSALQQSYLQALKMFKDSKNTDYKATDLLVRGLDRPPTDLLDILTGNILANIQTKKELLQKETSRVQNIALAVLIMTLLLASILSVFLALTISRLYAKQEQMAISLSKYLSPQIYKFIFSGERQVKVESHRKNLTVFFSDIQGFTQLTDSVEPEALSTLLNEYFNEMSEIALKFGGTVDKFMGDAIMIFYGDPESKGNKQDALDCILMGLEMRNRMKILKEKWQSEGFYEPLKIRAGVNSGYCTVGNFGSEDRLDYTIIGGTVNLASRLESLAEPDEIMISHQTYVLVKDIVFCEKREKINVKGIAYPIQTYRVVDVHNKVKKQHFKLHSDFNDILEQISPDELSYEQKLKIGEILEESREK